MLPIARKVTFDEVPVIDLQPMFSGDPAERGALARKVAQACHDVGFFYIVNHRIPPAAVAGMFEAAEAFFALPAESKLEVDLVRQPNYRGYIPPDHKGDDERIKKNLQEVFQINIELPEEDPDSRASERLYGPNPWPSALPWLRERMLGYYAELSALAYEMMQILALGLDLPEKTFHPFFRKPLMLLRLLHYPPQDPEDASGKMGTRPHTDTGAFTILTQDKTGGLEVMNRAGEWIGVPPLDGSFVVNIGEMMKVWSDGIYSATPHRVVNRYGAERYSVPFFANPDFDARISPLLTNPDPVDAPEFESSVARKQDYTCGALLLNTYRRIWPPLADGRSTAA